MKPRLTAIRKLTKDGNSLHITPPRAFLHSLGLLRGDYVELVLHEDERRFYVKPVKPRPPGNTTRGARPLPLEDVG